MAKILGQSGISLDGIYDIEGSEVGVVELDAASVKTVHEMGATIFNERLVSSVARRNTGAIGQNVSWDIEFTDFPTTPVRILSLAVVADTDRVLTTQVSVRDPGEGRELPIFVWDTAIDATQQIRWVDNGAALANFQYLRPSIVPTVPVMTLGTDYRLSVPNVIWRGEATAFGAGTVSVTLVMQIMFADGAGTSDRTYGLPFPSW